MKTRAALLFEYNVLPVYMDDNTKVDNVLSDFDYAEMMEVIDLKNNNDFTIVMVSIDFEAQNISVFSEVFVSNTQQHKTWLISDFTAPQQTIINNFIALL